MTPKEVVKLGKDVVNAIHSMLGALSKKGVSHVFLQREYPEITLKCKTKVVWFCFKYRQETYRREPTGHELDSRILRGQALVDVLYETHYRSYDFALDNNIVVGNCLVIDFDGKTYSFDLDYVFECMRKEMNKVACV